MNPCLHRELSLPSVHFLLTTSKGEDQGFPYHKSSGYITYLVSCIALSQKLELSKVNISPKPLGKSQDSNDLKPVSYFTLQGMLKSFGVLGNFSGALLAGLDRQQGSTKINNCKIKLLSVSLG